MRQVLEKAAEHGIGGSLYVVPQTLDVWVVDFIVCLYFYTVFQKLVHQTRGDNFVNS